MKWAIAITLILILLTGCHTRHKNPGNESKTGTSSTKVIDLDSVEAVREKSLDSGYYYLDKLLDSSIKIAYKKGFNKPFTSTVDGSVYEFKDMYAKIAFGNLFSGDRKHLIIQRFSYGEDDEDTTLYSDIFLQKNNKFKKVVADTSGPGYGGNYIEDVNQDGYADYIVYSYSPTGCCPRNLEVAYLCNPKNGRFINEEFFNRETDSLSDYFFETSYGLNEYINLYKYKWKGLRKILVEEIYMTRTKEGAMNPHASSFTQIFYPGKKKKQIKKLPPDFAKLQMAEFISPTKN